MHSTTLIPKALWMEDAENPREILAQEPPEGEDEIEIPTTTQMSSGDAWAHATPNILLNCLTEHKDAEAPADLDEEFDQEQANAAMQAADPYEKRLKLITLDAKVKVSENVEIDPWIVKNVGDCTEYAMEKQPPPAQEGEKPKRL